MIRPEISIPAHFRFQGGGPLSVTKEEEQQQQSQCFLAEEVAGQYFPFLI